MSDASNIVATINVEGDEEHGFFFILEDRDPVGPFETEEIATQEALDFLQAALTRLVEQTLNGEI